MEENKITIVSCSGASNTEKYTDEVARRMTAKAIELGKMINQRPIKEIYEQAEKLIVKNAKSGKKP